MTPPPALRKRMQAAQSQGGSTGASGAKSSKSPLSPAILLAAAIAAVTGICWLLFSWLREADGSDDVEVRDPEVIRLVDQATVAIRKKYNYTEAHEQLERAFRLAPQSMGVRQFYASVLLALGQVEAAWQHCREVFLSRTKMAKDPHFLQQYVLTLHRLGKYEELDAAWPRITRYPEVKWRTPLQCPDQVDESLLAGAEPFPAASDFRVSELLVKHKDAIINEFEKFKQRPDWDSAKYFRPNQDNDLVSGNEETRWTEMCLFDRGYWDPRTCDLVPTACRILKGLLEVEGIVHGKRSGQVSLLKLEAGTTLVPHFGSVNWRYVAHLGLLVPEGVVISGGKEKRTFKLGEVVVLDDSFLHSVVHNGTGPRVTLFANFFHPKMKPMTQEEWLDAKDAAAAAAR
eukprot:gnl/TRDRNA2_/TRDRNA2_59962_c0_seq1.p1 gnl/TRDRNA2_/TRDRNA2_59962_c0~~gnl/TRDRNA2_/TRDRNA2_59962_c0_seq1.p1  ORF type:complete len:424 (+),score=73.04 gnl/TRDRNA2_/TRDRNA2_59962_c0_seq1:70-1272(+)